MMITLRRIGGDDDHLPERIDNQPVIEMSMLGAIETEDELKRLREAGPEFMMYAPAYDFMNIYCSEHDEIPSRAIMEEQYPGWEPREGKFGHWLKRFLYVSRQNRTRDILAKATREVEKDLNGTISMVLKDLQSIGHTVDTLAEPYEMGMDLRLARYRTLAEQADGDAPTRMRGIKTGFDLIDQTRIGWMPSELIGIIARPATGKTWMLCRQAAIAWLSGKRVLMVSTEMTVEDMFKRVDVMMSGHLGVKGATLSHTKLVQGDDKNWTERYAKYVETIRQYNAERGYENRLWIINKRITVADVEIAASFYGADVILIDGLSLLGTKSQRSNMWQDVHDWSYDLKQMATDLSATVIVTHQTVNKSRGKKPDDDATVQGAGGDFTLPTENDVAYGDAFTQACSTIISLGQDRDHVKLRWYAVRKSRERGAAVILKDRSPLLWDVDRGVIIDAQDCGKDYLKILKRMREFGVTPGIG